MRKVSRFLVVLLISSNLFTSISLAAENDSSINNHLTDNSLETNDEAEVPLEETENSETETEDTIEEGLPDEEAIPDEEVIPDEEATPNQEETIEESEEPEKEPEKESEESTTTTSEVAVAPSKPETEKNQEIDTAEANQTENKLSTEPVTSVEDVNSDNQNQSERVEQIGNFFFSPRTSENDFILKIGNTARRIAGENDIYASIMIAQACLESGFGNSGLANSPHYNLFGIKGSSNGKSVNMSTQEEVASKMITINSNFRSYNSYKESMNDYVQLVLKGIDSNPTIYHGITKKNSATYQDATSKLVGVYATDSQYDQKLNAIIKAYDLTRFDYLPMKIIDHKMKEGESLNSIAEQYKVTLADLSYQDNPVVETDIISEGEIIKVKKMAEFELPLNDLYEISSQFGPRGVENHGGIDLAIAANTPVYAAQSGEIVATGFESGAGNYVIIKHDFELFTSYFHLNEANVSAGDRVEAQQQIGLVGSTGNSTGPHLHFGISDAPWGNYYNPKDFLTFK